MAGDEEFYRAAERRIEWLIAGIGVFATAATWFFWGGRAAAGLAAGAALSWVNYRWMKQGVDTLARLSTAQAGTQPGASSCECLSEIPGPLRFADCCCVCYSAGL